MSASGLTHPQAVTPTFNRAWLTPLELGGLAAIWGASFLFLRIAAPAFGPVPLVALRLVLGAAVLMPFLWRARSTLRPELWPRLALVGVINAAVPFSLFAWAARQAPAGVGAITNSMAVLFTALVAFLFYGERIGPRRAMALFAGFAGVVVLASGKAAGASVAGAVAAGTTGAFLYGIGSNLVRRHFTGLPAAAVAAATLACGAVLMLPFAVFMWPTEPIGLRPWLAASALGVLCTGLGYAVFYRLIQRIGAPRASVVTYLVPLFALTWAWLLLGEPLTPTMLVAGTLILGSVALGQSSPAPKAK
ncbi:MULTISPECIES: DMT family transporter [unclassified Corallococcus]|uniref:DMT family transporter n=1 Tax=unclassified Corallococcus TaxID=2685029 RepID=UPI001A9060DB|nr:MULTISPECIES: EamA family transporter [unclassified Corallococcus]MBN9686454.1 EamA family transporter [Corallococcus sp. NCSPR001]WAS82118.1 EamA family transporter [Corallococcus sp. NCRR]